MSVLLLIYMGAYLSAHVPTHFMVKVYLLTVIVFVSAAILSIFLFPESAVASKIGLASDVSGYWENLLSTKAVRSDAAMKIWQDHMWFGSGVDGFGYYLGSVLGDGEWAGVRINKGFVYNDLLQILCEFGLLGSAILTALIVTLLIPLCHRAHVAWIRDTRDSNAGRKYFLRISPFVVTGVVATLCCFAESFIASPFRMPAVFISFFIVMLTMPAFLPSR
jgi:O-antigen ligase